MLWVLASSVVIAVAIALTWQTINDLLRQEARIAAQVWADDLAANVADLDRLMTTGLMSNESRATLRSSSVSAPILQYTLFDLKGRTVYVSAPYREPAPGAALPSAIDERPGAQEILSVGQPIVRLLRSDGEHGLRGRADFPDQYGQIYLPVTTDRGIRGTAELYIDQSEKAAHYHQEFVVFATGLTLLILVAMAFPMSFVWRKTKQRELAERQLHDMAHTDPLTKLANRTDFRDRLGKALGEVNTMPKSIALFWLDLDRFKTINDALGHPVGDALLCQVASRLRRSLSEKQIVARLGGDEFAIVLTDCRGQHYASDLADELIRVLAVPFDVDGHHVVIGVSIGIVFAPHDGNQVDDLLKKADIALYRAKDAGRSTFRFFKPDMEARSVVRHALEEDLRTAINTGQLRLHYQPQVSLDSRRIVGFEALLRWHHPRFGHMPPGEVVALAEETGLIMPLGFWALKQACADATTWPEPIRVSVNISAVQFSHSDLVDLVSDALSMSGLTADRLDLEITESIVMSDSYATAAKLRKLLRLGVHLSMDDFGTGYSSLSRLRHLPFNHLKIDRSFVRELAGNRDDIAIVHAIVTLARSLGMQIIAEGVETDAQLAQLHLEGCDIAQGFFFGRPVPATEIGRQLGRHNPPSTIGLHAPRDQNLPTWQAPRLGKARSSSPSKTAPVEAPQVQEAVG
ncbi:MAG: putative bifunctional diguanylate cyclase/phosphodiesterase [Geminicoccaceae bacterium]